MLLERLQTAVLILGMMFFYFIIMPEQVDHIEDARIVPTTVPSIAIWIIILAAVFQFFTSKTEVRLNSMLCVRAVICGGFVIACLAIMKRFGFEFGAPILALGVMLGIGERRLHWIVLGSTVIPLGVWFLVEQVLNRVLP